MSPLKLQPLIPIRISKPKFQGSSLKSKNSILNNETWNFNPKIKNLKVESRFQKSQISTQNSHPRIPIFAFHTFGSASFFSRRTFLPPISWFRRWFRCRPLNRGYGFQGHCGLVNLWRGFVWGFGGDNGGGYGLPGGVGATTAGDVRDDLGPRDDVGRIVIANVDQFPFFRRGQHPSRSHTPHFPAPLSRDFPFRTDCSMSYQMSAL